jgi:hypothetical protein
MEQAGADGAAQRAGGDGPVWTLANEFAEVEVSRVCTRHGVRLRIRDANGGRTVDLCPLELESLTWQSPEVFSGFLATPFGPEEAPEGGPA